jgi:type 1 glutamine amidotransferase
MLKHTSILLLAASLASLIPALHAEGAPQPLRALLVTGGCCHDYATQKKILREGISARANVEWTIVHEGSDRSDRNSAYLKPDWAKGFDVVVHNECYGAEKEVAFVESIAAAHKAGVPAVMLHCSSHSYRAAETDEWRMAVGITSRSHEKGRDLAVQRINSEHPVMQGFPEMWTDPADELYKNEKVWPTAVPLAKAYGADTQQDHYVVWVNTYGKARVFSTTLGHHNATMADPVYLDLVTRGLLWSCDKLDPKGKALPGYGAPAGQKGTEAR